ncbi:MAG TPA: L-threonylcarbamoyladenylate synthase [Chitinophagales bacterium]|nr:L-threonylcarbamoyladenylate synthase [Chitinophagales bacterium]
MSNVAIDFVCLKVFNRLSRVQKNILSGSLISPQEACALLKRGGVVAIPTETVYGLAAKATDAKAIERLFRVKNRPSTNPLICHFPSFESAKPFLNPYPAYVDALQRYFMPGPVSFLLPLKPNSGLEHAVRNQTNVIVRVPGHPLAIQIIECVGEALAAPSANTSGRYSGTTAWMVLEDLGDKIDGVVDGGASDTGIESTILDCTRHDAIQILRPGSVGKKDIEDALRWENLNVGVLYAEAAQPTPGHAHRHYAPRTALSLITNATSLPLTHKKIGLLAAEETLERLRGAGQYGHINFLSIGSAHNPSNIGKSLYATLAKLDALKLDRAYIMLPEIDDPDWRRALHYRFQKMTETI